MAFLLVFSVSFGLSLLATPLAARLGLRWGLVAVPGERRRHVGIIPRSGGLALYVAFAAALILIAALPEKWLPPAPEGRDPNEIIRLMGVLVGTTFVAVVGTADDRWELSPHTLLICHVIASVIAIAFLIFIEVVNDPFSNRQVWIPWPWPFFITVFWIVGMMSTVNFLDGLDGLAAGVTAIAAVILTVHMVRERQYSVALLPLALLGSTLGFLPYNYHPAKVFMGGGAYVLGYALGTLSIIAGARVATILLVMGIPIADVAWQIYRRYREKRPIGRGDLGHLHHRLVELGLSQRQVVGLYCFSCAVLGLLALLISSRLSKFFLLLLLGAFAFALLASLTRRTRSS